MAIDRSRSRQGSTFPKKQRQAAPQTSIRDEAALAGGDPEFSRTRAGTQEQYPAAASRYQVLLNKERARKLRNLYGSLGLSVPAEFDIIQQQGFVPKQPSTFENILTAIGAPFRAINLAVQDISAGAEERKGFDSPNFGDYWNALTGEEEEVMLRTGHNPMSGSETLALWGWEEADNTPEKIARGVVDFMYQVAIDPLTYLTGGASVLGKRAAAQVANRTITRVVNEAIEDGTQSVLHKTIRTRYNEILDRNMDDVLGELDSQQMLSDVFDPIVDDVLRGGARDDATTILLNELRDEVLAPIVKKDFGATMLDDWQNELTAVNKGGLRFGLPWGGRLLEHGWQIPGTRGLGRKLVGRPFRDVIAGARKHKVVDSAIASFSKAANALDGDRVLLNDLRSGEISGSMFYHMVDGISHNKLAGEVNAVRQKLRVYSEALAKKGWEGTKIKAVQRGLTHVMEGGEWLDEMEQLFPAGTADRAWVDSFTNYAQTVRNSWFKYAKEAFPELNLEHLRSHMATSITPKMREFLLRLSEHSGFLDYAKTQSGGKDAAGIFYLAHVLDALGHGGAVESALATNRHLSPDRLGVAPVVGFTDGSLSLLIDPQVLKADGFVGILNTLLSSVTPNKLTHAQLNDFMEDLVTQTAERFNIPLPKEGARIFSEDPFETMATYVQSMSHTIMEANMLNTLEKQGLIIAKPKVMQIQESLDHIRSRLANPKVAKIVSSYQESRKGLFNTRAVQGLKRMQAKGKLAGYAETRRAKLSRTVSIAGRNKWERLVLKEARPEIPAFRKRFLIDEVPGPADSLDVYRQAYYSISGDEFLPVVASPDVIGLIRRGSLAEININYASNRAVVVQPPNMVAQDGTDVGAMVEKRAIEFLHARGFDGVVEVRNPGIRPTVQGTDTFFNLANQPVETEFRMTDVVRDLSDEAAYMSAWNRLGSVQYEVDDIAAFEREDSLIHSVAESFRKRWNRWAKGQAGMMPSDESAKGMLGDQLLPSGNVKAWPWAGPEVEVPWDEIHGMLIAYNVDTKKYVLRIAVDGSHMGALKKINEDLERIEGVPIYFGNRSFRDRGWKEVTGTRGVRVFGDQNLGGQDESFLFQFGDGIDPGVTEYLDGFGMWVAKQAGLPVYRAEEALGGSRNLRWDSAIFDPKNYDDLTLYQMIQDNIRQLDQADVTTARQIIRNSPLNIGGEMDSLVERPLAGAVTDQPMGVGDRLLDQRFPGETFTDPAEIAMKAMFRSTATKQTDWFSKMIKNYFTTTYGPEIVADVRKTTKELERIDVLEQDFMETLGKIFSLGLDADGNVTAKTQFIPNVQDEFATWIDEIKDYGEKLGISPTTWGVDKRYMNLTEVKLRTGRNFVDPSLFKLGGDKLEDKLIQRGVAEWFSQVTRNMASLYSPIGLANLKAQTNAVMRLWKTMVTITRPSFHVRNVLGGVWNNQIVGVRMRDYAQVRNGMVSVRRSMRKGRTIDEALNELADTEQRTIFRAAWNSGLLDLSFSRAEFQAMNEVDRTALAKRLGFINPFDAENFILAQGGAFFMESIEDFLRVSAFARWLDPKDIEGSAKVAKEMSLGVHFDYRNLTNFETRMKQFVPFFVWSRRNLPLQLQTLIEQPGLMTRYQHLMQAGQDMFPEVEQDQYAQSDYLTGQAIGTDIVLNENTPFWARIMIDPQFPVNDLFELGEVTDVIGGKENPFSFFLDMLGPGYQFARDYIEQKDFGPVNAPAPMNAVLSQMARAGHFDFASPDGDVQIPYMVRTIYNLLFPWSREYEDILGPSDPYRQQAMGQAEGQSNMESLLRRLGLGALKGLGVTTQTPQQTPPKAREAEDLLNRIVGQDIKMGRYPEELYEEALER